MGAPISTENLGLSDGAETFVAPTTGDLQHQSITADVLKEYFTEAASARKLSGSVEATPSSPAVAVPETPATQPHTPEQAESPRLRFDVGEMSVASERHSDRNEDAMFSLPDIGAFGVLDGVGGHDGGEEASRAARESILASFKAFNPDLTLDQTKDKLREIIKAAHQKVSDPKTYNLSQESFDKIKYKPGATASIVKIWEGVNGERQAVIANIGDSRVYILRADQSLEQVTVDDNYTSLEIQKKLNDVNYENDLQTNDENYAFKTRYGINKALGFDQQAEPTIYTIPLQSGDRLVLTTDGIHDNLTTAEIIRTLNFNDNATNNQRAADALVSGALERSRMKHLRAKPDDMSALVIGFPSSPDTSPVYVNPSVPIAPDSADKSQPALSRSDDWLGEKTKPLLGDALERELNRWRPNLPAEQFKELETRLKKEAGIKNEQSERGEKEKGEQQNQWAIETTWDGRPIKFRTVEEATTFFKAMGAGGAKIETPAHPAQSAAPSVETAALTAAAAPATPEKSSNPEKFGPSPFDAVLKELLAMQPKEQPAAEKRQSWIMARFRKLLAIRNRPAVAVERDIEAVDGALSQKNQEIRASLPEVKARIYSGLILALKTVTQRQASFEKSRAIVDRHGAELAARLKEVGELEAIIKDESGRQAAIGELMAKINSQKGEFEFGAKTQFNANRLNYLAAMEAVITEAGKLDSSQATIVGEEFQKRLGAILNA